MFYGVANKQAMLEDAAAAETFIRKVWKRSYSHSPVTNLPKSHCTLPQHDLSATKKDDTKVTLNKCYQQLNMSHLKDLFIVLGCGGAPKTLTKA